MSEFDDEVESLMSKHLEQAGLKPQQAMSMAHLQQALKLACRGAVIFCARMKKAEADAVVSGVRLDLEKQKNAGSINE